MNDLVIGKRQQTPPQGEQIGRKVPAVHRRYVPGLQRLQGLRVIPVVEVARYRAMACIVESAFVVRSMSCPAGM